MKWRIDTVKVKEFRSYSHPVEIKFYPGLNAIVGKNGSGKSNLVKAIMWGLGGPRAISETTKQLIPMYQGGKPTVEISLVSSSGSSLSILRQTNGVEARLNGKVIAKTDSGVAGVIAEHLGVYRETLRATTYVSQGEITQLLSGDKKTRMRVIERIQGTDGLAKIPNIIQDRVNELQVSVDMDAAQDVAKYSGLCEEWQAQIQDLESALVGVRAEITKADASMAELVPVHAELETLYREYSLAVQTVQAGKNLLQRTPNPVPPGTTPEELMRDLIRKVPRCAQGIQTKGVDTVMDEISADYADRLASYNAAEAKREQLERAEQYCAIELGRLVPLVAVQPEDEELSSADLEKILAESREQYGKTVAKRSEAAEVRAMLEALRHDISGENCQCVRCGSRLTEDHVAWVTAKLADLDAEFAAEEGRLARASARHERARVTANAWSEYRSRKSANDAMDARRAQLSAELEKFASEKKALVDVSTTIAQYLGDRKQERDAIDEYKAAIATYQMDLKRFHDAEKVISGTKKEVSDAEATIKTLGEVEGHYSSISAAIAETRLLSNTKRSQEADATSRIASLEGAIRNAREQVKAHAISADRNEKALKEIGQLNKLKPDIRQFTTFYQNLAVPLVEKIFVPVFDAIGGGEFQSVKIQDQYDIQALRYGAWHSFDEFSQAQKDTAALALRLALAKLNTSGKEHSLGTMLLDEPTASFDDHRTQKFSVALERLRDLLDQVIIVTHSRALADVADHALIVEFHQGNSTCSVL